MLTNTGGISHSNKYISCEILERTEETNVVCQSEIRMNHVSVVRSLRWHTRTNAYLYTTPFNATVLLMREVFKPFNSKQYET